MRISRDQALMEYAWTTAKRATCLRRKIGAIITRDGRPIVAGYNGVPSGLPHCSPETCSPEHPCLATVHAEANCIAFAARYGLPVEGTTMISTVSPCNDCAKLLINAGIDTFIFDSLYRDEQPLELLYRAGIVVAQWNGNRFEPFG